MVRLGNLAIDAPFYQAGLAGYSDTAMRLVARRHGCPYAVTEAMLDLFLLRGGKGLKHAELDPADHPIAGQLMGSNPSDMAAGAKVLVGLGYDVVDVNLACPVKKIRRRSRGGHLMGEPDEAIAILDAVRQAVPDHVPTTVKLRRGSDDSADAERNFHRIFEAVLRLGYAGATVHGRTVAQKYIGPSRWEFLADLVARYGLGRGSGFRVQGSGSGEEQCVHARCHHPEPQTLDPEPSFLLGGSGDIWTAADIFRMIEQTGVHWVSVARGCIGNPWVFEQARAIMRGDEPAPPTIEQQRRVLLDHFELSVRVNGEELAGRMMRKFGIKFARHHPERDAVAKAFIAVHNTADWRRVVDAFYSIGEPAPVGASL